MKKSGGEPHNLIASNPWQSTHIPGSHPVPARLYWQIRRAFVLEAVKTSILFVSALFPIVNPLGGSPIFLALTPDYSRASRRLLSQRIAINSFVLLVVSSLIGTHILAFFGISLPIVQVRAALILIPTAWAI